MGTKPNNKPNWKKWDEFLVDAWIKDGHMRQAVRQFIEDVLCEKTPEVYNHREIQAIFAKHGINSRSPKTFDQLRCPVRALFFQCFPKVSNLLWENKGNGALALLRKHKIREKDKFREESEYKNLKARFSRLKSSSVLRLIPGTNAIHVSAARRAISDWNTVKPSRSRDRTRYSPRIVRRR